MNLKNFELIFCIISIAHGTGWVNMLMLVVAFKNT